MSIAPRPCTCDMQGDMPCPRHGEMGKESEEIWSRIGTAFDPDQPIYYWWLSFCDPDKPEGEQFLGAVIVKAPSMSHAITVSHLTGCNPGGEVQVAGPIGGKLPAEWTFRVLSAEEVDTVPEPA